jgi:hypothetical protein
MNGEEEDLTDLKPSRPFYVTALVLNHRSSMCVVHIARRFWSEDSKLVCVFPGRSPV